LQKNESDSISGLRRSHTAEDKLRKRLLTKKPRPNRDMENSHSKRPSIRALPTKHKPPGKGTESGSEDDAGRTALKRGIAKPASKFAGLERSPPFPAPADSPNAKGSTSSSVPSKKRVGSYLDEMLQARSEKRRKKQKIDRKASQAIGRMTEEVPRSEKSEL
jgi:hypothetical protein